jgi:hypothetical protein
MRCFAERASVEGSTGHPEVVTMHVRVSLVTADPRKIDDVVNYVAKEARPIIEEKPGSLGMTIAVNDLGVAVVETFWVSGDAMRESERHVSATRVEAARRGGGTVSVEHFAVASVVQVEAAQTGAGVRLTRSDIDAAKVDAAVAAYEDSAVPWLVETAGFCIARLYVDRRTGRSLTETLWSDESALVASRSVAATIRADAVAATGALIRAVEEYTLACSSGGLRPTRSVHAVASSNRSG